MIKAIFKWCINAITFIALFLFLDGSGLLQKGREFAKNQLIAFNLAERVPRDAQAGLNISDAKHQSNLNKLLQKYSNAEVPTSTMISIQPGRYVKGCIGESCEQKINNDSIKMVDVAAFEIGETEVTVEQWDICVAMKGCDHMPDNYGWGRGDLPVVNVSWIDVQQYITWLNSVTEGRYRLPTDAEWEYAAKADTKTRFPWGDSLPECDEVRHGSPAWVPPDQHRCQIKGTWSVRSKTPNPWGLYHVIGNAAEWTSDCGTDAQGFDDCNKTHINRGGNWCTEVNTSVLHTRPYDTTHRYNRVGFRLARDIASN